MAVFLSLFFCIILTYILWNLFGDKRKYPPGPRGLPVIGNTHQAPRPFSWKWYEELRDNYGKIFRLRVLGDNFVILNDPAVAESLLGGKSAIYSSRKFLPYAGYYRSGNKRMILMEYGAEFTKQRSAMQMLFRPEGVISNRARQEQQAKKLMLDLLTSPEEYVLHLRGYSAGIALGVAWGMTIEAAASETMNLINNTAAVGADLFPGLWLVDIFNWLDKLPDFLARWRPGARDKHQEEIRLFTRFASHARLQTPLTTEAKSLVARLWDAQRDLKLDDNSILYVGGSVGEAGTNTTACALHCFLLACTTRPDVVKTAQEELDRVLGDRIPTFEDFNNLPFLFAVVKEVLRWIPVTPLSFPHFASEDDEYEGHYIPKGSQVVASIWNMHRNSELFPKPAVFEPMRWYDPTPVGTLKENASLLNGIWTFGFGRRGCPGKRLAVDSVWIGIAHILWAFTIQDKDPKAATTRTTNEVDANLCWRDAVNVEPKVLNIKILSRSKEKAKKVEEEWDALKMVQTS